MTTIYFQGTREELRQTLEMVPQILSGQVNDPTGLVEGLLLRVGMTALSLIREAFLVKARGGTDAAGDSWEPLKPATIERRRLGPEDRKNLGINRRISNLTTAQKKTYRREYRNRRADMLARGVSQNQAESLARAQALNLIRAAGGNVPTRREILGSRTVEILRDTGVMFNSLSPGVPLNVQEAKPGNVIIGTNVPYAVYHHEGRGTLPVRRLWPEPEDWPDEWWSEITEQAVEGLAEMVIAILSG